MRGLLIGLGLGAGLMYLWDPAHGAARREQARRRWAELSARRAEPGEGLGPLRLVDDEVIVERVRLELGRLVSRPFAVMVSADEGVVTLRGPVLPHEVPRLLEAVRQVPGVTRVGNQLEVRQEPAQMPQE